MFNLHTYIHQPCKEKLSISQTPKVDLINCHYSIFNLPLNFSILEKCAPPFSLLIPASYILLTPAMVDTVIITTSQKACGVWTTLALQNAPEIRSGVVSHNSNRSYKGIFKAWHQTSYAKANL